MSFIVDLLMLVLLVAIAGLTLLPHLSLTSPISKGICTAFQFAQIPLNNCK